MKIGSKIGAYPHGRMPAREPAGCPRLTPRELAQSGLSQASSLELPSWAGTPRETYFSMSEAQALPGLEGFGLAVFSRRRVACPPGATRSHISTVKRSCVRQKPERRKGQRRHVSMSTRSHTVLKVFPGSSHFGLRESDETKASSIDDAPLALRPVAARVFLLA